MYSVLFLTSNPLLMLSPQPGIPSPPSLGWLFLLSSPKLFCIYLCGYTSLFFQIHSFHFRLPSGRCIFKDIFVLFISLSLATSTEPGTQ